MGHARLLFRLISLTSCVLTATSACGPGGIGSSAIRPGEWGGTGDQGFKIEFAVAQNSKALTFYSFFYPLPCTKSGGFESVVSEGNVPLNGSQFELSGAHIRVTARFVAPERAEGTWTVKAHRSTQFGDCRETNGTWVAWAKDAGTPTPAPAPTATPPPALPTSTPIPPTATVLPTHTLEPVSPWLEAGAQYSGPLNGGTITFTIGLDGASIRRWSFHIPGAVTCAEGGTVAGIRGGQDAAIPIRNQAFEYVSESFTFRGLFDMPMTASGSLQMKLGTGRSACSLEPLEWTASSAPTSLPVVPTSRAPTLQPSATTSPILQPTLTPTPTPAAQAATAPVIESVTLRYTTSSSGLVVFQDVKFRDPDGDAYTAHYELVRSTETGLQVADGTIDVSSQQQKLGTTITGQWDCGGSKYDVTLAVTLLDRAGNRSNVVEYTMNCR